MDNETIEKEEAKRARDAIKKALEILGEHYDAVQILASHETVERRTVLASWGYGNWFARQGMAHEFISVEEARNFAWELNKSRPDED